jgi:hypothetical protein
VFYSKMVNATLYTCKSFCISRGKLKRLVAQFGPFSWVDYDWRSTSSLGRWIATVGIILVVSFK